MTCLKDIKYLTKKKALALQPIYYASAQEKLTDSRFVVETKHEEPVDLFAEQQKWIGNLCKFWDKDNDYLCYGPLTKIHDTSLYCYCYECNHESCYRHCEPVSEDMIYKEK